MSVTVFLPIFKVQIEFQVKHGRPWTSLEQLLLWSISVERRTVSELAAGTNIAPRMVIECLINLMRAGWIEVRSSSSTVYFGITEAGSKASRETDLKHDFHFSRRFRTFYIERLTDAVLKTEGIRVVHYLKAVEIAKQQDGIILEPSIYKAALRPHDIMDQLALEPNDQFEAWLDHRVLGANLYAILRVRGGRLEGVPDSLDPKLSEAVLEATSQSVKIEQRADLISDKGAGPRLSSAKRFRKAFFSESDLIVGGKEHLTELKRILSAASSYVIIHSTFVGRGALDLIIDDLKASAERGVEIDLLWGERDKLSQGARNESAIEAAKLSERLSGYRNSIKIGTSPTGSHCKMILADSGPGRTFEAIVGSCNWLSSVYKSVDISARIKDPKLVQDVAHAFSSLQMPSSGRWDRAVMRVVRIAEECRLSVPMLPQEANAMLIVDEDHYAAVREARDNAKTRILAGCDWLGTAAETSVFVPVRTAAAAAELEVRLLYQRPDERVERVVDEVRLELKERGVELLQVNDLHGKYLMWDDDSVVIGSFNWLSTVPYTYTTGPAEVGIFIEMPSLASKLRSRLKDCDCPA